MTTAGIGVEEDASLPTSGAQKDPLDGSSSFFPVRLRGIMGSSTIVVGKDRRFGLVKVGRGADDAVNQVFLTVTRPAQGRRRNSVAHPSPQASASLVATAFLQVDGPPSRVGHGVEGPRSAKARMFAV